MDQFEILYDNIEVQKYLLSCITSASKTIFISAWNIDLTYIIDKKNKRTLFEVLSEKCNEGVKVYLMGSVAPGVVTKSNNMKLLSEKNVHPNFNIKILDMEVSNNYNFIYGILSNISSLFSNKSCCNRLFHQRYFLVDDKYCLICNTDSNDDKECSLIKNQKNKRGFIWVEYSVKINPTKEIINYARENYKLNGKASMKSDLFFGNFYSVNTEYNKIISMIKNSKKMIFVENQWLQSSNRSKNKILLTIADKIISEYEKNNKFKIIFILEENFIDECTDEATKYKYTIDNVFCYVYSNYFQYFLYESLFFLKTYLCKKNKNINFDEHIHIYSGTREIFIHSKNWIFDFENMLIGSANIWDRSYTYSNDIELSLLLTGPKVKTAQKDIVTQYNKNAVFSAKTDKEFVNNIINSLDNSTFLNKIKSKDIFDPFKIWIKELFLRIIFIIILISLYKFNKN